MAESSNNAFIQDVQSALPKAQRAAVQDLINEKRLQGHFLNRTSLKDAMVALQQRIKANGRAFMFNEARKGSKISSDYLNGLFEDIKIDLDILYSQMGVISSDNSRMKVVVDDNFITTKANIHELIGQLRLFRFLRLNPEFQDAKFITFANAINRSPFKPNAFIDSTTRTMKLPLSKGQRLAVSRFNLDRVTAEATHRGGGLSSRDDVNFGIERSLDANPETFYGDIVLCDGNPNHRYYLSHSSSKRLLGSGVQQGHTYTSSGIIFELTYSFAKTASCNQIRLLPIADYPLRVIDLCYKTTDSSKEWITIPGFDPSNYEETLDWLEWNGHRFYMTHLKVVLEQQNYTTNIYHIPSDLLQNNQLWSQILDRSYQDIIHNIELDAIAEDKIAANPETLMYLNELSDLGVAISNSRLRGEDLKDYEIAEQLQAITAAHMSRIDPSIASEITYKRIVSALKEVRRLQFVAGLRIIEVNDNSYQPFAFYESQKFASSSNILEVRLETNETHPQVIDSVLGKPFNQTSIEWELQLGNNIFFPIAPVQNKIETSSGTMISIQDEVLVLNRRTLTAVSRFPIAANHTGDSPSIQIRKNGIRLSPTVPNSGLGGQTLKNHYTVTRLSNDHLQVAFDDRYFDQRAIYTISYMAHEQAAIIDINDRLNSEKVTEPESFAGTDKDNKIQIKFFPYTEYSIVNDDLNWTQDDPEIPRWRFVPSTVNYSIGKAGINTGDLTVVTGQNTFWLSTPQELVTGNYNGLTGAAIQFLGDNRIYPISGITSDSGLVVYTPIETGFLPNNGAVTGLPYVIGKIQEIDGQIFGLTNVFYEPIEVYVDDIRASNKTDYNKLEHAAFVPQTSNTRIYEYIQAGKNIYFNAPIDGKIEVSYRYLTEYLKVNATLRSHKPVNPTVTPVVENYQLHIKNSKI